jgi:hypothetical protein
MNQQDCYAKIMQEIFGEPMIPLEEWDWVEFVRDMEESLVSIPQKGARCRRVKLSLKTILIMYGRGMKYQDISDTAGCGYERVRQMIYRALRSMRHPNRSERLAKWSMPSRYL